MGTIPLRRSLSYLTATALLIGITSPLLAQDEGFKLDLGCLLPFAAIAPAEDPFVSCGNCGVVSAHASPTQARAKAFESRAKNNFCADTSSVTVVNFSILREMQVKPVDKSHLGNRHVLHSIFEMPDGKKIGEGDVVRLKAWVSNAHVSDCPKGESVNCSTPGFDSNDIHIPLLDPTVAEGRGQDECTSVTAEMSPHFRPAAWSQLDLKTPVKNVVRVTGPLFFDNSHKPCVTSNHKDHGNAAPFRSSLWEVHPVYHFEVCANTDPDQCDVNSASSDVWIPYDEWVSLPGSVTEPTGKRFRTGCNHPQPGGETVPAKCPTQ